MMKFYAALVGVFVLAIAGFIYWDYSTHTMKGSSKDGTWKVLFQEQGPGSLEGGWMLSVEQKTTEELTVKKLAFLEGEEVIVSKTEFSDWVDNVDGTVHTLHPFSYPDLFFGDPPTDNISYQVQIVWQGPDGEEQMEYITLN